MKNLGVILAGIFLVTVIGCKAEPPKFGVADVVRVINSSKAGQKANMEIDALVKAKQAELKDREETVKKLEKSLKEPGSKVKQEEFNKAAIEYQRMAQAAESEIKKKAQELRTTVLQQIKKIIETIGEENNFLMIFTTDNVPFFQKTLDVTDQIIKKLDESGGAGSQTQPPVSVEPLKMPSSPAPPPPPAKK